MLNIFGFYLVDSTFLLTPNIISFLINLSGVLIGAFLAYILAIWIERRQRKHERIEENIKLEELNNDRLMYLSTLTDNILSVAKKQSAEYEELSNIIIEQPYENHLVKLTLTNDLQRIKQLDSQKMFDSYNNAIASNSDRIKNYSKFFHCIDFLDLKMTQMSDIHKNHCNFTFKDQCYIRDIIDDLSSILSTLAIEIIESNNSNYREDPVYQFIEDLLTKSATKNNYLGFEYFEIEFILPLRDKCRDIFQFNLGLANLIFDKTKRATSRYKHIKFNSIEHANVCKAFKSEIEATIIQLFELNEEIKQKLNS